MPQVLLSSSSSQFPKAPSRLSSLSRFPPQRTSSPASQVSTIQSTPKAHTISPLPSIVRTAKHNPCVIGRSYSSAVGIKAAKCSVHAVVADTMQIINARSRQEGFDFSRHRQCARTAHSGSKHGLCSPTFGQSDETTYTSRQSLMALRHVSSPSRINHRLGDSLRGGLLMFCYLEYCNMSCGCYDILCGKCRVFPLFGDEQRGIGNVRGLL